MKSKICAKCSKPSVWKIIRGKGYCQRCTATVERELVKAKKEKEKAKRAAKREIITDKKLDTVFAKKVKEIYKLTCHACNVPLEKGTFNCQACHFIPRAKKEFRWDVRNVYPGCARCNGFDSSHVYELGKRANQYWGPETAEAMRLASAHSYQWTAYQKKKLYELYTSADVDKNSIYLQYLQIKLGKV